MIQRNPFVRGVLILAIAALVAALVFFVYSLTSMLMRSSGGAAPPDTSTPRPTQVWRGEQAQSDLASAEAQARDRALAWKPDAALVQAEGSWRIGENWTEVETPPVAWTFGYYSAEAGQVAAVGVSDAGVSWTTPRSVQVPPRPLADFPPPQGPEIAWLSFRAYDGERFLGQHAGALVKLRLTQTEEGPRWSVSALKPPHRLNVQVDATTGGLAEGQN